MQPPPHHKAMCDDVQTYAGPACFIGFAASGLQRQHHVLQLQDAKLKPLDCGLRIFIGGFEDSQLKALTSRPDRRAWLAASISSSCGRCRKPKATKAAPKPPLTGLLLRNLNEVTILGEPYYLLYIPIMVTLSSLTATQLINHFRTSLPILCNYKYYAVLRLWHAPTACSKLGPKPTDQTFTKTHKD